VGVGRLAHAQRVSAQDKQAGNKWWTGEREGMTRHDLLSIAVSLTLPMPVFAKPPTKVAPRPSASAQPLPFTIIDLCSAEEAERVAISEAGTVLLTTESATAAIPTQLWSKGKLTALPKNFVGLDFGAPGTVLGYVRTDLGTTRAASWKAGAVQELLPAEDGENTKAVTMSRSGTIVLILSSGDCGILTPGAKESSEVGRSTIGDVVNDPFRPIAISATAEIIVGNQGDRAYRYDAGAWDEIVAFTDVERTVVTAMDKAGHLACGYVASGDPAKRRAWVRNLQGDENTDDVSPLTELPPLSGKDRTTYPNLTALALSDDGVVGFVAAEGTAEKGARAVLWRNGVSYDLTSRLAPKSVGWIVTEARAIGSGTTIVAIAEQEGKRRAVLLTKSVL